jgi:hypothetical protein
MYTKQEKKKMMKNKRKKKELEMKKGTKKENRGTCTLRKKGLEKKEERNE